MWIHPPLGTFKFNLDGSFLQSAQQGGIGGIIKDWNGVIVRNSFGPVDCSDANDDEVFALLMGCHDL